MDIFEHFYEKSWAERILERVQGEQDPEGRRGFLDLSGLSAQEKEVIREFKAQQQTEALQRAQALQYPLQMPESPMMVRYAPPSCTTQLKRIVARADRKRAQAERSKTSAFDLMELLLSRVTMVHFQDDLFVSEGGVFRRLSPQGIREVVYSVLEPELAVMGSPAMINSVVELLRANTRLRTMTTTELPDRLYFLDGVLEVGANIFRPIEPAEFFTSYLNIFAQPQLQMSCPTFDSFLADVCGGDVQLIQRIWEMMGYLLVPDMEGKVFFVLQGVGDSGKSVLGRLIASFFNEEAVSYLDIFRFKDRFSTFALQGKRLNVSMDLPSTVLSREAVGTIKLITGGDVITVEGKFQDSKPLRPTCKLVFGTNHPLLLQEADAAFENRMILIPFLYAVPKGRQDKDLDRKLLQERPAIVIKAAEAYRRLKRANYQFTGGSGMRALLGFGAGTVGYVSESELMGGFLANCCAYDEETFTTTERLFAAYKEYCAGLGTVISESSNTFSKRINKFCAGRLKGGKKRVGGVPMNGYYGIALNLKREEIVSVQ